VTKRTECDIMKILIKAIQPHRQRILTADGEEIRLQRWANKKFATENRSDGPHAGRHQFTQGRDKLMYDAVANPEEYGIKFLNERVPFEGQNLQESLSEPDYSGEAEADFALRQEELEQAMKEGTTPNESQEDINADKKRMPNLFDSEGKLRDGMPPEEEEFKPDAEAEHMRRIMTSRQVPMRDAWSILKNDPYDWQGQEYDTHCPKCRKGIYRQDEDDLFMIQNAGMCTDCMMA